MAIFGGMGIILAFGWGFFALMSAVVKEQGTQEEREFFGCEAIPYGLEIHNKITPNIECRVEFLDDVLPGAFLDPIGTFIYSGEHGAIVQIERHLEKLYNENYAEYYDIDTFIQYGNMWILAHELVHIADIEDRTVNYTERMTEKRAYEHFMEMADGDEESVFYKAARFMVLMNSFRADGSAYKW